MSFFRRLVRRALYDRPIYTEIAPSFNHEVLSEAALRRRAFKHFPGRNFQPLVPKEQEPILDPTRAYYSEPQKVTFITEGKK